MQLTEQNDDWTELSEEGKGRERVGGEGDGLKCKRQST